MSKKDIIETPDKGVSAAKGVLAKLFRTILRDLDIRGPEWEKKITQALDDPAGSMPKNSKDRSTLKGNLNKMLKADRLTWKNFQKGLRLLAPKFVKFEVHLTWPNGKTTVHTVSQQLGNFTQEDLVKSSPPTIEPQDIRSAVKQIEEMWGRSGGPRLSLPKHQIRPAEVHGVDDEDEDEEDDD